MPFSPSRQKGMDDYYQQKLEPAFNGRLFAAR